MLFKDGTGWGGFNAERGREHRRAISMFRSILINREREMEEERRGTLFLSLTHTGTPPSHRL